MGRKMCACFAGAAEGAEEIERKLLTARLAFA
jgi:hypothetical protein